MRAILLAAGEGTRLRPFTNVLPKPCMPFLNVPLFGYSFFLLRHLGIQTFVMNHHHLSAKLLERVRGWKHLNDFVMDDVMFSDETGKLLGSGGGIAKARTHLHGDDAIIAVNADEVILPYDDDSMIQFRDFYFEKSPLALLLTMDHPEAGKKFGAVWVDDQNRVHGFGKEKPKVANLELFPKHFLGVQILSDRVFKFLPNEEIESNILYDALVKGIAHGESVMAYSMECHWFETGNLKDFLHATGECLRLLASGRSSYLKRLLAKLSPKSKLSGFGSALVLSEGDLLPSSVENFVVIGEGATFPRTANLDSVVIESGASVQEVTSKETIYLKT